MVRASKSLIIDCYGKDERQSLPHPLKYLQNSRKMVTRERSMPHTTPIDTPTDLARTSGTHTTMGILRTSVSKRPFLKQSRLLRERRRRRNVPVAIDSSRACSSDIFLLLDTFASDCHGSLVMVWGWVMLSFEHYRCRQCSQLLSDALS